MKKASDFIDEIINSLLPDEKKSYLILLKEWPNIAGYDFARHTKILEFSGPILRVGADHSVWMQFGKMNEKTILGKIREVLPKTEITKIEFKLGIV
ncbi:MAG: DUF721 domain-containing protein [Spirochaetales bacterium]|nr:DUF721 domain-containing protein [Spirochaetales bacterium]